MRPFGSEGLREGHGGLGPSCSGPVLGKPSGGTNVRAFRSRNSGRSRDSGSVGGGRVWPKLLRVTLPKAIHPSRLFGELRPCFCGAGQQAGSVRCPGSSLYPRAGCSQQSLAGLGISHDPLYFCSVSCYFSFFISNSVESSPFFSLSPSQIGRAHV